MPTPPRRRGLVTLPDGRRLGWSAWGPETGDALLFFEGAASSSWLGFDAGGRRLVAFDRPGLGRSDPAPGRGLLDVRADVAALIAALDHGRPTMVGFSQGAPFALACAELASSVVIAAGSDELATREDVAPELAPLLAQVASDPAGAEAFFARMTAEAMRRMVIDGSDEADRAVYLEPAFDAAYRRALEEGFAQGAGGYARDTIIAMSPWPLDLGAITTPVHLVYGARDRSPVHAPDHGARLEARLGNARRTVVGDAGGAVLWTHLAGTLAT